MKKTIVFTILILLHISLIAQNQVTADPDQQTNWWGDPDGYLNQQAKISLRMADEALKLYPPEFRMSLERKLALITIDNVLHEEKAAYRPSVQAFLQRRIEQAVKEISSAKVTKGAVIWKLYDHAFVVKTASVTIGFDIQRGLPGVEGFTLSKELIQKLIDSIDILFVSHYHSDHADPWVAEMFLNQDKPVVTPPNLWESKEFYGKITHPKRKAAQKQTVHLSARGLNLQFVSYPGHQGEQILNNVYLVFSPEGFSFAHTGDQSNVGDFEWIDRVGKDFQVDVLMTNSWAVYPDHRLVRGFHPRLTLPGHENEMGHTIDHREPYWLNELRLGDPKIYPWIQMAWGEKFHYQPNRKH